MSSSGVVLPGDDEAGSDPGTATRRGISAVILTIFGTAAIAIGAFVDRIGDIFDLISAGADFIVTLVATVPGDILEAGGASTINFLLTTNLGPAGFGVALMAVAFAWWVWDASDVTIPFVGALIRRLLFWRDQEEGDT